MLGGVIGPEDEDEKRAILADTLAEAKAAPGLYRAVAQPDTPLPGHTLEDARKLYLKEKLNGGEGEEHKDAADAVARVCMLAMFRMMSAIAQSAWAAVTTGSLVP